MGYLRYQLFVGIVLSTLSIRAQYQVNGVIKDSLSTLMFANVIVTNQDNQIITGATTDEGGTFNFFIDKGNYKITISLLGYSEWVKPLVVDGDINLGIIIMNENVSNLKEVSVTAQKTVFERKVDRFIFNVENSIVSKGFNGLDAIKFAPRVNQNSETLSIIGKNTVVVMVNNKVLNITGSTLDTYLKLLRSDNIKKIEVITSPSAKFDAQGRKGVINIVLKNSKGFDGSATAGYVQRSLPNYNISSLATFSTEKLTVQLSLSPNKENRRFDLDNNFIFQEIKRNSDVLRVNNNESIFGNIDLDYQISKSTQFGFILNGNFSNTSELTKSKTYYSQLISQKIDSTLSLPSKDRSDNDY